jgi:hypothetical protein
MPSIKNRWVKPGGSFNWTEGVKVYNKTGSEIAKYAAVQVAGIRGGIAEVQPANASSAVGVRGRILFMRHATPAGEYGVATPWILIEGQNTNATNLADPWYIDATGNGTLVAAAPGNPRVVGKTIVKDATNGAIELADTMALP